VIVNCTEFDNRQDIPEEFTYYHIHVEDYGVPSDAQINQFLKITDKHQNDCEPIVVHCVAGCGRTGQFIVAWGAHNGSIPNNTDPVKWIRQHRSCSLETNEQMKFARQLATKICKRT
jgi:protein-tyrosine phosphatase